MDKATQYWNKEWKRRDEGHYTKCNTGKFQFIQKTLKSRASYIAPLETLEIGCGSCLHIKTLAFDHPEWKQNYIGIDLSETGIAIAKRWGINAEVASIYDFESDKKFELFLFFDSLEHLNDHNRVAAQIKKLAADRFCIMGNIPLYESHNDDSAYERKMDVTIVSRFLKKAGINKFAHIIYGVMGWPYMWFEAQNGYSNSKEAD